MPSAPTRRAWTARRERVVVLRTRAQNNHAGAERHTTAVHTRDACARVWAPAGQPGSPPTKKRGAPHHSRIPSTFDGTATDTATNWTSASPCGSIRFPFA